MDHKSGLALAVVVILSFFIIFVYNLLVRKKNRVREAWSNIDVQLKRRHVLVPNLLSCVKAYMQYEQSLFIKVTQARNECVSLENQGPTPQVLGSELKLSTFLSQLWALVENYPDIKANQTFLDFQKDLVDTEDQIQLSRRYYNGAVRDLNICVESFPSNLIAKLFRFKGENFFQIDNPMHRKAPKVNQD